MKIVILNKITMLIAITVLTINTAKANGSIDIDYTPDTNHLSINASKISLEDALTQLSKKMGFKLFLDDLNLNKELNINIQGESKKVINQLLSPSSAVIAQSSDAPHNITKVIVLPLGTSESVYLPRKSLQPPTDTSNPIKYKQHMEHYKRKLKQQTEVKIKEPRDVFVPPKRKLSSGYKSKTDSISIVE